ncbi:cupin domain-containing protein [Pseudomonas azerbaijanoccidentalis]
MRINADFSRRAVVCPEDYRWLPSPRAGVERVLLDRIGAEQGRATSLVRYAPGSRFPCHRHPGGEEILVLDGVFSDGTRDFPAGSYIRNPPGSMHQPWSVHGALLFVKLGQMTSAEVETLHINTRDAVGQVQPRCLFESEHERVELIRSEPLQRIERLTGGAEVLVLEGQVLDDATRYPAGTWLRWPVDGAPVLYAGLTGAVVYLKTGHLAGLTGEQEVS